MKNLIFLPFVLLAIAIAFALNFGYKHFYRKLSVDIEQDIMQLINSHESTGATVCTEYSKEEYELIMDVNFLHSAEPGISNVLSGVELSGNVETFTCVVYTDPDTDQKITWIEVSLKNEGKSKIYQLRIPKGT